jgi:hypothetical protein
MPKLLFLLFAAAAPVQPQEESSDLLAGASLV